MRQDYKNLIDDIETRFKTLMIGSISRFEKYFGYLWNHGDEPNTKSEEKFRDMWETLRVDLLNHGNNQIRLAIDELIDVLDSKENKYRYNYKFVFKDKNKE
jgi:hypothetical protein